MKTSFFFAVTYFAVIGIDSASYAFGFQPLPHAAAIQPSAIAQQEHEHSHSDGMMSEPGAHGEAEHMHGMIEVPASQPLPTVKLIVHPDAQQGWNLEVQVTNFKFAPEHVNQVSVTTEGHAHLYVDGEKITRLYGNWYYLSSLPPGKKEITVALNTNGHESLMHNGEPIQASVILEAATPTR